MSEPPATPDPRDLLVALLNAERKREAERVASALVLSKGMLVDLILGAQVGVLGAYRYASAFPQWSPAHLEPTDDDLRAIATNGVGPLSPAAEKAFRKIDQTYQERRLGAAHLLYTDDHARWHLFCFDQRDLAGQHWAEGSHVHDLARPFTREPLDQVWQRVARGDRSGSFLHLRIDWSVSAAPPWGR